MLNNKRQQPSYHSVKSTSSYWQTSLSLPTMSFARKSREIPFVPQGTQRKPTLHMGVGINESLMPLSELKAHPF